MAVYWKALASSIGIQKNGVGEAAKISTGEWSRKQKRGYHRVRSLLYFWESHNYQVR